MYFSSIASNSPNLSLVAKLLNVYYRIPCLLDEPAYAVQWRALPPDFQQKMLAGIVAFELQVTDLQCKLKLNQHRPESHARMHEIYTSGTADALFDLGQAHFSRAAALARPLGLSELTALQIGRAHV